MEERRDNSYLALHEVCHRYWCAADQECQEDDAYGACNANVPSTQPLYWPLGTEPTPLYITS